MGVLIPFFCHGLTVNTVFAANSSNVTFANLVINSTSLAVNSTIILGNSASVGNSTVFANDHFSKLEFVKGANSAVFNSSQILMTDASARTAKINTSNWVLDSGNTLVGSVSSLVFGNSTVNTTLTTNSISLRNTGTFLRPNSVQIDGGAILNTTALVVASANVITPVTASLVGNSAALSVFNSTANGVMLAANSGGPINGNVHIITGATSWRKSSVWQQFVTLSGSSPTITWPGATFAIIDVTGIVKMTNDNASLTFRFHYNGATQGDNYGYLIHHIDSIGSSIIFAAHSGGPFDDTGFIMENGVSENNPVQIKLRFYNCEGVRPMMHSRACDFRTAGGLRVFEGWIMRNSSTVPNANGVTGFQFDSGGGTKSGNLTITGIPF